MIKGVGPQRAELLAKRGIHTLEDLLTTCRSATKTASIFPNKRCPPNGNVYTLRVQRRERFQAVRGMRGGDAIYHMLVEDETGLPLACKFFHGGYLEGRLKSGQLMVLHGKVEVDSLRPARIEMVNPQIELLSDDADGQSRTPPKSAASFPFTKPSAPSARARFAAQLTPRYSIARCRTFPMCCQPRFARA